MCSEPRLSVVVPVHNGSEYLRQCLDSLVSQTLESMEIIVVDDASTDVTPSILRQYAAEAPRAIRVITQPQNGGVSMARNAGIVAARGEFIAFVDADDWVDPEMYEALLDTQQRLNVDVVSCGMNLVDEEGESLTTIRYPIPPQVRIEAAEMKRLLSGGFMSKMLWCPVRSIYRTSLLESPEVRFDENIRKGEDSLFNLEVLSRAEACAAVRDPYYRYRQHAESVTARPLVSESQNIQALGDRVTAFYRQTGYPRSAVDDFYRYLCRSELPTAIVRLIAAGADPSELRALRAEPHVRTAISRAELWNPDVPARVRLLLVVFKHAPLGLLSTVIRTWRMFGPK